MPKTLYHTGANSDFRISQPKNRKLFKSRSRVGFVPDLAKVIFEGKFCIQFFGAVNPGRCPLFGILPDLCRILVKIYRTRVQTATQTGLGFKAGVKDYRLTYYMKDYRVDVTDLLAAFRVIAQPGVPPEEAGAAIAAESSTGTWTTVWTDGLTSLDRYKGRCYDLELVSGEESQYIAYIAYPLDLFEEGSVTNILTSIVGNVFGFKALK